MRKTFPWYFRPLDDEYQAIWKTAILSTDANVLLDLYRYHQSTRDALLARLQEFSGRVWLTRQAADEFVKNRHKVIADAQRTFEAARKALEDVLASSTKAAQTIKGSRLLPPDLSDRVQAAIKGQVDILVQEIDGLEDQHPNYLREDPILDAIATLFQGAVAESLDENTRSTRLQEAARRFSEKIPPGYMDDPTKDGDRKYGDYLIWAELLDLAKAKQCSVVFVTSEDKEDWWEKYFGRRIGPRPELLSEAFKFSGQRILIYRTDQFVEIAADRTGTPIEPKVLEEIREVRQTPPAAAVREELAPRSLTIPEQARQAIGRREFDEVVELYRPFLRDNPHYHVGWIELGYALRELAHKKAATGDDDVALGLLRESLSALELAMGHRDAHYRAQAEYQKSKTLRRLAILLRDSDKRAEAIVAARRAQTLSPSPKYESWLRHLERP